MKVVKEGLSVRETVVAIKALLEKKRRKQGNLAIGGNVRTKVAVKDKPAPATPVSDDESAMNDGQTSFVREEDAVKPPEVKPVSATPTSEDEIKMRQDHSNISQVEMTVKGIGSKESFSPETLLLYSYLTNRQKKEQNHTFGDFVGEVVKTYYQEHSIEIEVHWSPRRIGILNE